ncbi:zinc-dependent peptidase [bacterium]|nr:zinc-dependent peptidase [bacterium]MBU1072572.1 zinc-dependent peptidase [bacterium]MBU1675131.1 zinc-dependent peptidase [bacterium]
MFDFFKKRRRRRLCAQPFPDTWLAHIRRNAPLCKRVPEALWPELLALTRIFVAEKNFEGCGGLEMTNEVRVTIAAQACLLLLGRETDVFPQVQSVLVYSTTFVPRMVEEYDDGVVEEYDDPLDGEAWGTGAVILAWDDVLHAAEDLKDGYNVVLHEFAHQLDLEIGDADGTPRLGPGVDPQAWADTLSREYQRHCRDVDRRRHTLLDEYGADDPAEFFAVATENYLVRPQALKRRHPDLYAQLRAYFGWEPES